MADNILKAGCVVARNAVATLIQDLGRTIRINHIILFLLDLLELVEEQKKSDEITTVEATEKIKTKQQKGDSHRMTLQLFREGKNIAEIARERSLAMSTIEGHLASFLTSGEIDIKEIVPEHKITAILQVVEELNVQTAATSPIKEKLGDEFSHGEIRAVLYYRDLLQVSKAT